MAIFVIRHGSAGERNGADANDSERDLDPKGRRQAEEIAKVLAGAEISRILSSPYPRCLQTVQPLAEGLGVEVEPTDALAEGADLKGTLELVEQNAEIGLVLCSHGDVIPELMMAMERRGTELDRPVGFAKASIWTLSGWQGHCFANASYRKVRP